MPELPEVQALAEFMADHAVGRAVARADLVAINALKTFKPPLSALSGQRVRGVARHGKFLDLELDDLHLVIHLARAGWLRWRDDLPGTPAKPGRGPLALRVHLVDPETGERAGGFELTEAGTQKRLSCYLVERPEDVPGVARLGPDPMAPDFTVESLRELLSGSRTQLKGALRDQSVLAGIGNAYSDEVLHAARLSPFKISGRLSDEELSRLHNAIIDVLSDATGRARGLGAASLKAEKKLGMRVHGRTGQPCPVCGDTIREVSFADSSLQYCPTCQTGGQVLADRRLSRLLK